jgi:hypothetical protein
MLTANFHTRAVLMDAHNWELAQRFKIRTLFDAAEILSKSKIAKQLLCATIAKRKIALRAQLFQHRLFQSIIEDGNMAINHHRFFKTLRVRWFNVLQGPLGRTNRQTVIPGKLLRIPG